MFYLKFTNMFLQRFNEHFRQRDDAVFTPLASPHVHLAPIYIYIHYPELATLFESETATVHEGAPQPADTAQVVQDAPHFFAGEYCGQEFRPGGMGEGEVSDGFFHHELVETDDGTKGLLLRGGRNIAFYNQAR